MTDTIARSRAAPAALRLAILLFGVVDADALSLRGAKTEVFLGDVRPGSVVVLSSTSGQSPFVENAGAEPLEVLATWEVPPSGRLKDGFDPLPDRKWIALKGESWTLAPGQRAQPLVAVSVPKERRLEGVQLQFDCVFRARAPGGSEATLRTAVLLAVGEAGPGEIPRRNAGSLIVSPAIARVEDVALGLRQPARSETFRAVKLANAGASEAVVRLSSARAWDETVRLEDGYAPAPNPNWLKTGPPVSVAAGEVAQAALELEIPRQARYRGRKWAFVVAVDVEQGGRRGRSWWTLYVRTSDREEKNEP